MPRQARLITIFFVPRNYLLVSAFWAVLAVGCRSVATSDISNIDHLSCETHLSILGNEGNLSVKRNIPMYQDNI